MSCERVTAGGLTAIVCSRGGRRRKPQTPPWSGAAAADLKWLDWLLENAEACEERLSPRERVFIDDMAHRRGTHGDQVRVSERQMTWLEDMVRRVG